TNCHDGFGIKFCPGISGSSCCGAKPDGVVTIFLMSAISQIQNAIVLGFSVEMAHLAAHWTWPQERSGHQAVNPTGNRFSRKRMKMGDEMAGFLGVEFQSSPFLGHTPTGALVP